MYTDTTAALHTCQATEILPKLSNNGIRLSNSGMTMTLTSLSYKQGHKINISIQPLTLTAVTTKASLQALWKGLRVRPTIEEAKFLTNRLIDAITSLHYTQNYIFSSIAATFGDVSAVPDLCSKPAVCRLPSSSN
jgi:hypothetical protein